MPTSATAAAAPRRRRRRVLWLLLPLLLVAAFLGLRHLLQPQRLSDFLLRQAQTATGLELSLAQPASVGVWPDLHLALLGLEARAPGVAQPMLRVEAVDVALSWSSLGEQTVRISRLRLRGPVLDLDALGAWLATRDAGGPPAPVRLPALSTELAVDAGRVIGSALPLDDLRLRLDRLIEGRAGALELSAVARSPRTGAPQAFALSLRATPRSRDGVLHLDALHLALRDAADAPSWLEIDGTLVLAPPRLQAALDGALPRWPAHWPALPLPGAADAAVALRIEFDGSTGLQGRLVSRLGRAGQEVSAQLELGDLGAWIDAGPASWLPPLQGSAHAPLLEFEGTRLHGVDVRIEPDPTDAGR